MAEALLSAFTRVAPLCVPRQAGNGADAAHNHGHAHEHKEEKAPKGAAHAHAHAHAHGHAHDETQEAPGANLSWETWAWAMLSTGFISAVPAFILIFVPVEPNNPSSRSLLKVCKGKRRGITVPLDQPFPKRTLTRRSWIADFA